MIIGIQAINNQINNGAGYTNPQLTFFVGEAVPDCFDKMRWIGKEVNISVFICVWVWYFVDSSSSDCDGLSNFINHLLTEAPSAVIPKTYKK